MAHNHHKDGKFTVVLLGSEPQRKRDVGKRILGGYNCTVANDQCRKEENNNCVIVNIPSDLNSNEFLNLKDLFSPAPQAFLLVLETREKIEVELARWEKHFPNMRHFTIIIMDEKNLGDGSEMAGRCLDIGDQGLRESCERVWRQSISGRYCYQMYEDSGKERRGHASPVSICLLGGAGSGKSASGNTILGSNTFLSRISAAPVTTQCQSASTSIYGTEIRVIDTPDFFDEDLQEPNRHIRECRQMCEGYLCVYLLTIQIGRIGQGADLLEKLEKALQARIRDKAIILFTFGDELRGHHIDDYVRNTDNPHIQPTIRKCGDRYHMFNNRYQGREQVKELMGKIATFVQDTSKGHI